ncbi:MAG TPA: zinc ribbon domain-containing protein [Nevskiaceae bacterium]|nr:zinc ribbon domain-containing protein [Nevskiaceae bacterium]
MPIYEYVCKACGAESEILQKVSDPPAKECPVCHKRRLVKTISAAGFRLAGGGWYETDFKSGNKKNLVEKGEPAKAEPAKAESKPESKAAKDKTEKKDKKKAKSATAA